MFLVQSDRMVGFELTDLFGLCVVRSVVSVFSIYVVPRKFGCYFKFQNNFRAGARMIIYHMWLAAALAARNSWSVVLRLSCFQESGSLSFSPGYIVAARTSPGLEDESARPLRRYLS